MFSIFKRSRKEVTSDTNAKAEKVAGSLLRLQYRWASYMAHLTGGWSKRQKIVAFSIFLLLIGVNSGVALYQVFQPKSSKPLIIDGKMKVPRLQQAGSGDAYAKQRALAQLLSYRRYLDSLRADSSGLALYRQIQQHRPGLVDSIYFLTDHLIEQSHE